MKFSLTVLGIKVRATNDHLKNQLVFKNHLLPKALKFYRKIVAQRIIYQGYMLVVYFIS